MENKTYEIYYGRKMLMIALVGVIMGVLITIFAIDRQWTDFQGMIMGIGGTIVAFASLAILIDNSYFRISKMPVLIIDDDRLKKHSLIKIGYSDVKFEDVDDFQLGSIKGNKFIVIKYTPTGYRKLIDKSNGLNRVIIEYNMKKFGMADSLNTSNMAMTSTDIYKLLMEKFNNYQKSHKV
jgi:hypothetical protein